MPTRTPMVTATATTLPWRMKPRKRIYRIEKARSKDRAFLLARDKRNSSTRRPGERRDPYAVSSRCRHWADAFCNHRRQGLWVPAQGRDDEGFVSNDRNDE